MELPKELQGYKHGLETALRTPDLASWPDNTSFHEADQARAIAGVLIPAHHTHLTKARIAFIFKENHNLVGETKRAGKQLSYLAHKDFIITLDWNHWHGIQQLEKIALVDHLLTWCGVDDNLKWVQNEADIVEFGSIVRRWGFYHKKLRGFAKDVKRAFEQTDLFTQATPEKPEGEDQTPGFRAGVKTVRGKKGSEPEEPEEPKTIEEAAANRGPVAQQPEPAGAP